MGAGRGPFLNRLRQLSSELEPDVGEVSVLVPRECLGLVEGSLRP